MSRPIVAFVQSGVPGSLVWDAEGAYELRSKWRVVGGLCGCLPGQPRQSSQLGLPLLLSPEETTILRERGVVEVRRYSPPVISSDDIEIFHELREKETRLQFESYQKRSRELSEKHSTHDSHPPPPPPPPPPTESSPLPPPPPPLFSPLTHTLTGDPRAHTSPAHFPAAVWTYPHTPHQKLQYTVFRDLWLQGFSLTTADKYGGDYLVYTGDPALVHSRYVALVLPWKQPIRMLSASCRLGSKVAKSVLLCSVDNEKHVHYTTVEWAG